MKTEVLSGFKHESTREKVMWFSQFSPSQRYKIMTGFAQFILTSRSTNKKGKPHVVKRTHKTV